MTKKEIVFTKVNIDKNEEGQVELSVQKFDFPLEDDKNIEIEKIIIEGSKDSDEEEKKIKDKSVLDNLLANLDDDSKFELSFEDDKVEIKVIEAETDGNATATAEPTNQLPVISINEEKKTLTFKWNPTIITLAKHEVTDGDENDGDTTDDDSSFSKPTCQAKTEKIGKTLTSEGVTEGELTGKSKTDYEKLKNNEFTDENAMNEAETEVNKGIYEISAEKKLTDLTARVNQAIKDGKEADMKSLDNELDKFMSNSNYQSKKVDAEALSAKLKAKINGTANTQNGDEIPWKKIGIGLGIGAVIIIGVVIFFRRKDTEIE